MRTGRFGGSPYCKAARPTRPRPTCATTGHFMLKHPTASTPRPSVVARNTCMPFEDQDTTLRCPSYTSHATRNVARTNPGVALSRRPFRSVHEGGDHTQTWGQNIVQQSERHQAGREWKRTKARAQLASWRTGPRVGRASKGTLSMRRGPGDLGCHLSEGSPGPATLQSVANPMAPI